MNKVVTLENIIKFQDVLIETLETAKEGDLKGKLFIESYKSQIVFLLQHNPQIFGSNYGT